MLGNLLLVFREVLEAALIISIVAAATRGVPTRGLWIGAGIALGLVGAAVVAAFAGAIGDSMSGMGQEWFNAGVLLAAVVMISWHVVWMARHSRELSMQMKAVGTAVSQGSRPMTALLVVVALAVLREGSEVVLFGYGLMASGASMASLVGGGLIGLALGVAVGLALYFGLLKIPVRHFFSATNALLVLLAAGLASSAAGKLVQADVLPTLVDPLWDSSWLLTDESVVGNMMHVLVGYTAQPSGMQLVFYAATVVLLLIGMRLSGAPAPAKAAQSPAPRALA
ncbi:MAG: iron permease [Gammaproteobacteria bacterium RIFCSPHIGHO2_12_FULL_63_22]|nr:MAG: iron permease [Gammaproteobacteria bacterium RIFCSPHIGHO2_12_FULL_63_22]